MRLFLGLAATLTALWSAGAAEAACTVKIIGEVKVQMERRTPLLDVEINGKPARMILDTGAFYSQLFSGVLKDYGLVSYEGLGEAYGVGGVAKLGETTVPMMRLGSLTAGNMRMMVVAGNIKPAAGLIGANFLSQSDVEFDLAHGVVRFLRAQGCKGDEELYWGGAFSQAPMLNSPTGQVILRVLLNGAPFEAELDTGAFESTVSTHVAAAVGGTPVSDADALSGGGIGPARLVTKVDAFRTFTIDQETANNPQIGVADLFGAVKISSLGTRISSSVQGGPDMLLGADFFLSHRILVSYSQSMVYLTYSGGPIFDPIKRLHADKPAADAPAGGH